MPTTTLTLARTRSGGSDGWWGRLACWIWWGVQGAFGWPELPLFKIYFSTEKLQIFPFLIIGKLWTLPLMGGSCGCTWKSPFGYKQGHTCNSWAIRGCGHFHWWAGLGFIVQTFYWILILWERKREERETHRHRWKDRVFLRNITMACGAGASRDWQSEVNGSILGSDIKLEIYHEYSKFINKKMSLFKKNNKKCQFLIIYRK